MLFFSFWIFYSPPASSLVMDWRPNSSENARLGAIALLSEEKRARAENRTRGNTPFRTSQREQLSALMQLRRRVESKQAMRNQRKSALIRLINETAATFDSHAGTGTSAGGRQREAKVNAVLQALLASQQRRKKAAGRPPPPVVPPVAFVSASGDSPENKNRSIAHGDHGLGEDDGVNSGRNQSNAKTKKTKKSRSKSKKKKRRQLPAYNPVDAYAHLGNTTRRMLLPVLRKKGTLVTGPKMGPWGIPYKGTSMDSDNILKLFSGPGGGKRHYVSATASQFVDFTPDVEKLRKETGHVDSFPMVKSDMSKYTDECGLSPFTLEMRKPIREHRKIHNSKFSAGQGDLPLSHSHYVSVDKRGKVRRRRK